MFDNTAEDFSRRLVTLHNFNSIDFEKTTFNGEKFFNQTRTVTCYNFLQNLVIVYANEKKKRKKQNKK